MKKIRVLWMIFFLVLNSFFLIIEIPKNIEGKYLIIEDNSNISYDPIRIESNSNFEEIANSGNGSFDNPWIIENYEINGSEYGFCIYISDTTDYFLIRNCYIFGVSHSVKNIEYYSSSLILKDMTNGKFINNIISSNNNKKSIILESSRNNTFIKNNITGGIFFGYYSNENNFINNNISNDIVIDRSNKNVFINNNVSDLISIDTSKEITLKNNKITGNGLIFQGISLDHWNTHTIDTSNIINNKSIQYWKNKNEGNVPIGASQIILINCTNVIVENQRINEINIGIQVVFSSNNTITNNTVDANNEYGINILSSRKNIITNNNCLNNNYGIYLLNSESNIIRNNTCNSNDEKGISLLSSNHNTILNNTAFFNQGKGIGLGGNCNIISNNKVSYNRDYGIGVSGNSNTISNNIITNHSSIPNYDWSIMKEPFIGIYLAGSYGNTITKNTIINNFWGIYLKYASHNTIYHNNIINNDITIYSKDANNRFDAGYPYGGNYYSESVFNQYNYKGKDSHSGYNQDELGSDKIGDRPFSFKVKGKDILDNFPLMEPYNGQYPDPYDITIPIAKADYNGIYYDDFNINTNTVIKFDGSLSTDNIEIINYTWKFKYNNKEIILYGAKPSFKFSKPGKYLITLNVTDNANNWNTDEIYINVEENKNITIDRCWVIFIIFIIISLIIVIAYLKKRKSLSLSNNKRTSHIKLNSQRIRHNNDLVKKRNRYGKMGNM
jgi:parallel beta-helix repeat protein